ncbi:hypothetical protein NMS18_003359 [Vibrio cholerae]|nr:hypothetical protein [Vibrio cholerae]EJL6445614.1 hypothetical protein [Vibrio cholerae]EJU9032488.1 hypothetical protein [Vibrio cholerae]
MRNRIWEHLQESKFKAEYLGLVSKKAYLWGNTYSFILAFSSAGCVAAWSIWKTNPTIWAIIVAISQVLHLAKPYMPYIKHDRDLFEMGCKYESLYVSYEQLWFAFEKSRLCEDDVEKRFYELRKSEQNFLSQFKQIYCPEFPSLMKVVSEKTSKQLDRTFS